MARVEATTAVPDFANEQLLETTFFREVLECSRLALFSLTGEQEQAAVLPIASFGFVSIEDLRRISTRTTHAQDPFHKIFKKAGANRQILQEFFPRPEPAINVYADPLTKPDKIFLNRDRIFQSLSKTDQVKNAALTLGMHLIYVYLGLCPKPVVTQDPEVKEFAQGYIREFFEKLYQNEKSFREPEQLVGGQDWFESILADPQLCELQLFGGSILCFVKEKTKIRRLFSVNEKLHALIIRLLQHTGVDEFMRLFEDRFFANLDSHNRRELRENMRGIYQEYLERQALEEGLAGFKEKRELVRQFLQKLGYSKPREMYEAYQNSQILPAFLERRLSRPELTDIYKQLIS